jgi:ABC-2 type transport system permease protein
VRRLLAVFSSELGRIFSLLPAFAVMVLAPFAYALLYPQPYINEALRDVPIAVVDHDNTQSSRELARRVDATTDVGVALVLPDLPSAERAVYERRIHGILYIPQYFERDLLHGRASPVALYADASYFLMYQRISGGVTAVARAFGAETETTRLIGAGVDPAIAPAVADPMPLTAQPLFNPQGGYATYVLPAALVLILQQTLLIGVGLLGTLPGARVARDPASGDRVMNALQTVSGKVLAYLVVEAVVLPFYLVALPYFYGVPRLGSLTLILVLAIPFVVAASTLGILLAAVFRQPLAVQLATASLGLPLFFLTGFSWPPEAIPDTIRAVAAFIPSTAAINAFVGVAQLGAPLIDVRGPFLLLWGLAALYGVLAVALEATRREPS